MSSSFVEPASGFLQFPLRSSVQRGVAALKFVEPRPIQAETIPAALAGRDVLGLAQTGTGKTAAFVLPILERLLAERRPGPRALIMAPTRELATQIHAETRTLAQFTGLRSMTVFGGVSMGPQIQGLRRGPDILIACPGRLLDVIERGAVKLGGVETLVLDEADHMFDIGFLPTIRKILARLPAKRQNLMFSATMPKEIRSLADELLNQPHVVELGYAAPPSAIEHGLYAVEGHQKVDLLLNLLAADNINSAIVFSRTKHRARRLAEQLSRAGHSAVALQGNMSQAQRDRAMSGFRSGRFDVLVATDIAARGIDVAQVSHVINFDIPSTPDAYTHRIGRTGRAERSGMAYTFVSGEDRAILRAIERRLGSAIPRLHASGFGSSNGAPRSGEASIPRDAPSGARSGFEGRPGGPGRGPGTQRRATGSHSAGRRRSRRSSTSS